MKPVGDESKLIPEGDTRERRTFLTRLGASALGASVLLFGTADYAQAYQAACCNLVHPPGSWSNCTSGCHYIWSCYHAPSNKICQCCEKYTQQTCSGPYISSAYKCGPV